MSSPRDGPNPLRPYYIPPSIGPPPDVGTNATSTTLPKGSAPKSSFNFPDLDYSDYIPEASPSVTETLKDLVDKAIWKYTSVLIAQPFEVAKTILQVYVPPEEEGNIVPEERITPSYSRSASYRGSYGDDSSDEEPNYFSSSAPYGEESPRGRPGRPSRRITDRDGYIPPSSSSPHSISLKNPHSLLDALSSLSSSSGALSLWKGTNATFVYSVLARTTETFLRSLIAALLALPDTDLPSVSPSGVSTSDILTTAYPLATLIVSTAASTLTAIILSPIDTARTRLILTPSSQSPRSLMSIIRTLPTPFVIPSHLIPITTLTSLLPSLLNTSAPLLLKSYLSLDPILTPTSWSIATFLTSTVDLFIRLPLETILRRAQISTFTSPTIRARASRSSAYTSTSPPPKCNTIVPVQIHYRGIISTAWSIVHEEGYSIPTPVPSTPSAAAATALGKDLEKGKTKKRKGQGIEGLYRGWRVGMWGLVGIWGAGWMGGMTGSGLDAGSGIGAAATSGRKF